VRLIIVDSFYYLSEISLIFKLIAVCVFFPIIIYFRTLEALLNRGFEPNERIQDVNKGTNPLNEMIGYTPLQILGAAALDILHKVHVLKCNQSNPDLKAAATLIASSAEMLVTKGARLSVDEPFQDNRFKDEKKTLTPQKKSATPQKRSTTETKSEVGPMLLRYIDPSQINLERNQDILKILDKNQSLAVCRAKWQRTKLVKGCGQTDFLQGKGLSMKIEDSKLAGGSNEKNCAVCWKKFGSLRNRKHICRASRRYVSEECSSKTVLLDGDARRVSDGQFNLAKHLVERREEQERVNQVDMKKERKMRIEKAWAASHGQSKMKRNALQETQKDEGAAKEELFGTVGRAMKNFFMEEVEVEVEDPRAQDLSTNDRVSGVMSSLSQTGEAFRERGDKLNTLVEKTDALKNASVDFAKMAKELKESQQGGMFW
jgi:hypothetical protein